MKLISIVSVMAALAIEHILANPTGHIPKFEQPLPELPDSAYALDPSVPSVPKLIELLDRPSSSLVKGGLVTRDETTEITASNFRFYYYSTFASSCTIQQGCSNGDARWISKRDNCNKGLSNSCWNGDPRKMENMSDETKLCDLPFTACRLESENTRWNLIMRRTADADSCTAPAHIFMFNYATGRTYASLHDRANGRHIGWCWFDNRHKYSECRGGNWVTQVRAMIRCGWNPL